MTAPDTPTPRRYPADLRVRLTSSTRLTIVEAAKDWEMSESAIIRALISAAISNPSGCDLVSHLEKEKGDYENCRFSSPGMNRRKSELEVERRTQVQEMREKGLSTVQMARELGVDVGYVLRMVKQIKLIEWEGRNKDEAGKV